MDEENREDYMEEVIEDYVEIRIDYYNFLKVSLLDLKNLNGKILLLYVRMV